MSIGRHRHLFDEACDGQTTKSLGNRLRFAKRQMVYQPGDEALRLFEVIHGALIVFKLTPDGRRQIVELVQRSSFCGFAVDGRYNTGCEARADTVVITHTRSSLEVGNPVHRRLLNQLERQCCALHDLSLTLGRRAARERLANYFLQFVGNSCAPMRDQDADIALRIPLTRAEIADHLGLSLETVSREIGALASGGLVKVGRKRGEIHLRNIRGLRAVA